MEDEGEHGFEQPTAEPSNVPLMWMHLTWMPTGFLPIIPLIIWRVIGKKNPQAGTHCRNILNASFTFLLFHTLSIFTFLGALVALITFEVIEGEVWRMTPTEHGTYGVYTYTPNPIPGILLMAIYMSALVCAIVSIVTVSIAARKGKVLPYWWAIRFFKTA